MGELGTDKADVLQKIKIVDMIGPSHEAVNGCGTCMDTKTRSYGRT